MVLPEADFGGVYPGRVTVDLAPFEIDLMGSATTGRIVTEGPLSGTVGAELSEEEVSRLAREGSYGSSFPLLGVDVEEGLVVARTEAAVLGQVVPVSVGGSVSVQNGVLVFEPERVEAFGLEVPEQLTARLLQGTSFAYPIEEVPPGIIITGVEAKKDRLVLTGEASGLQVG